MFITTITHKLNVNPVDAKSDAELERQSIAMAQLLVNKLGYPCKSIKLRYQRNFVKAITSFELVVEVVTPHEIKSDFAGNEEISKAFISSRREAGPRGMEHLIRYFATGGEFHESKAVGQQEIALLPKAEIQMERDFFGRLEGVTINYDPSAPAPAAARAATTSSSSSSKAAASIPTPSPAPSAVPTVHQTAPAAVAASPAKAAANSKAEDNKQQPRFITTITEEIIVDSVSVEFNQAVERQSVLLAQLFAKGLGYPCKSIKVNYQRDPNNVIKSIILIVEVITSEKMQSDVCMQKTSVAFYDSKKDPRVRSVAHATPAPGTQFPENIDMEQKEVDLLTKPKVQKGNNNAGVLQWVALDYENPLAPIRVKSKTAEVVEKIEAKENANAAELRLQNGLFIISGHDGTLRLSDAARTCALDFLEGEERTPATHLAVCAGNKLISVHKNILQFWDIANRTFERAIRFDEGVQITHFAMYPDGRHFVLVRNNAPSVMELWDIEQGVPAPVESFHAARAITTLTVIERDSIMYRLENSSDINQHKFPRYVQPIPPRFVDRQPDDKYNSFNALPKHVHIVPSSVAMTRGEAIAVGDGTGALRFFDEKTGGAISIVTQTQHFSQTAPLTILSVLENGNLACSTGGHEIYIIDSANRTVLSHFNSQMSFGLLEPLPEQRMVVADNAPIHRSISGIVRPRLKIFTSTGACIYHEEEGSVSGLAASPSGTVYYSPSDAAGVVVLTPSSNSDYKQEPLPIPERCRVLGYCADQLITLANDNDTQINIWQTNPVRLVGSFALGSPLLGLRVMADNEHYITAHADLTFRIWNADHTVVDLQHIDRPQSGTSTIWNLCSRTGRVSYIAGGRTGIGVIDFPYIQRLRAFAGNFPNHLAKQMQVPRELADLVASYVGRCDYSFWNKTHAAETKAAPAAKTDSPAAASSSSSARPATPAMRPPS